jgi:hypothetical protein
MEKRSSIVARTKTGVSLGQVYGGTGQKFCARWGRFSKLQPGTFDLRPAICDTESQKLPLRGVAVSIESFLTETVRLSFFV